MITATVWDDHSEVLEIGRQGENEARSFIFDISKLVSGFEAGGSVMLFALRPGEIEAYPCVISVKDYAATWTVQEADVEIPGDGYVELQYVVNGTVVKSKRFQTSVSTSVSHYSGTVPEPQTPWVQQVLNTGARAEAAARRAELFAKAAAEQVVCLSLNQNLFYDEGVSGRVIDTQIQQALESEKPLLLRWTHTSGEIFLLPYVKSWDEEGGTDVVTNHIFAADVVANGVLKQLTITLMTYADDDYSWFTCEWKEIEEWLGKLEARICALEDGASGDGGSGTDLQFHYGNSYYSFKRGMTWADFVDSDYNPTIEDEDFGTYKLFAEVGNCIGGYYAWGTYSPLVWYDEGDECNWQEIPLTKEPETTGWYTTMD